ncbi:MAG: GGDEF domain-containing protein [Maricaulaceae bacterium]
MRSLLSSVLQSASENTEHALNDADVLLLEENERLKVELGHLRLQLIELERVADTDPLVPLYNRRAFIRELSRAQTVSLRYDITSTVVYFDLDNFKSVNDIYDHSVGDEVLKTIAAALQTHVRDCDVIARIGGDEFAALLFKTDIDQAFRKADEVSQTFSGKVEMLNLPKLDVSVSWGVAECIANTDPEDILSRADGQMFANKRREQQAS